MVNKSDVQTSSCYPTSGITLKCYATPAPQIRRSILDFVRVTNHCIVLYCIVLTYQSGGIINVRKTAWSSCQLNYM